MAGYTVEIVAIGTELLLGQIVDTNSSWMGDQLALAGLENYFQVKVGDNHDRMVETLRHALSRADAVICCGGLGPTQDDITRAAIAEIMGVGLVRDDAIGERIRAMFESRGRTMSENNLLQADVPEGAWTIPQQPGTAPGLVCPIGDKVIYAVPGVPHEMKTMLEGHVLGDLAERAGLVSTIRSRTLRTWGQSESGLAEMLDDRMNELDAIGNPTLAFNASGIEGIKVRITAKADDAAGAEQILDAEERSLRTIIGDLVFGVDDQTMETVVLQACRDRGASLAVVEGATGGLSASRFTAVAGHDDTLIGTATFTSAAGANAVLGVDGADQTSVAVAEALVRSACSVFGAGIGIATSLADDAGTVALATSVDGVVEATTATFPGGGDRVRQFAVIGVLDLLRRRLS